MLFKERIQELRKKNNLTQEQLANALNITPQSISKWENGLSTPDLEMLLNIANKFNVSCDYLLGNETAVNVENKDVTKLLLRIEVNEIDGDNVKINLPLGIIKVLIDKKALNFKNEDLLSKIDFNVIFTLIEQGVVGKLLEVNDKDGSNIAIYVS